jgi:hypothetical protein
MTAAVPAHEGHQRLLPTAQRRRHRSGKHRDFVGCGALRGGVHFAAHLLQNIFEFQTVNELNVPIGQPNANTDIVNGGAQGYIFWFTTTAPFDPITVQLNYDCANTGPAPIIVNLPGTNGSNAFALSAVNAGSAATITVTPSPSVALPLLLSICETN